MAEPRRLWIPITAAAVVTLAGLGFWLSQPPETPAAPSADVPDAPPLPDAPRFDPAPMAALVSELPSRPNLILVSVDTARADHLSTYGYARETSPGLTAAAEHGAIFTRAYSTSSWTLPAVASMLSGLWPSEHGVLRHRILPNDEFEFDALPAEVPSLPRLLQAAGYRTVGVTASAWLVPSHGFGAGFDVYESLGAVTVRELEAAVERLTADLLADERPFFLWIHVLDPHSPYDPPDEIRAVFTTEPRRPELDQLSPPELLPIRLRRLPHAEDIEYLTDAYDAELRTAFDGALRLLDRFDDEPYVALVTSDHGEELHDHGGLGHGHTLFEEGVRVPFVLLGPALTRTEIATPVSLVDVLPTFLELAGAPPAGAIAGRSLVPILRGESTPARDLLLESGGVLLTMRGIVRGTMKYGYIVDPPVERLIDLSADPAEREDLVPIQPEVAAGLRADLDRALDAAAARRPAPMPSPALSEDELMRLRALGYLR